MSWLKQITTRLGFRLSSALPMTDLLVTFEDGGVSVETEVPKFALQAGELRPGDRLFGDYKINRLLGAGGFGEVYLVEMAPEGRAGLRYVVTGVFFALKRVRAADPRLAKALRHELQAWGELPQHPNLLRYRFFRVSGDELYIASEYVKGGSLADRLNAGPLPIASIIDFGMQIVWGLAALHNAGFLHGDLKPSNVLLDEEGTVARLCDYGLSVRFATNDNEMRHRLWDAPRGHTPAFASPEQARGDEMQVAADVWSLGALLLAAAVPRANWTNWRSLQLNLHSWVHGLPAALAQAILTSLQGEAAARASLDDVEADLQQAWAQAVGGSYSRVRPVIPHAPRQELSEDWYAARSIALQSTDPLFEEIEAEEAKDTPDETRLNRLHEIMMLGSFDLTAISTSAGRTTAAQDVKILEMLEGACAVYRELIREGRTDLLKDLAHASRALGDFHNRRGDLQAAADAVRQFAETDVTAVATDPESLVIRYEAVREAAVSLDMEGRPYDALDILNRATEALDTTLKSMPLEDAASKDLIRLQFIMLTDRGIAFAVADENDNALEAFERAFSFAAEVQAHGCAEETIEPKLRANALVQRANSLDRLGQNYRAVPDYERAIALLEAAENTDEIRKDLESARLNLGVTLTRMDDVDRAVPLLEAVVSARAARLAPIVGDADHRWFNRRPLSADWELRHRLAFAHYSLASALDKAGESDRAKFSAEQAHDIWKQLVENEGQAHLGQYQYHAMMQVVYIGIDD